MNLRDIEQLWKKATNNPNHDTNWFDPVVVEFARLIIEHETDMTLRDYFAAKAMSGMCFGAPIPQKSELETIAKRSYDMADAMLKARGV